MPSNDMLEALIADLERESRWYANHPRAHQDDHGMCAISPTEADDTASLMRRACEAIEAMKVQRDVIW